MGEVTDHEVVSALHALYRGRKVRPGEVFKAFNVLLRSRNEEMSKDISIILEGFYPATPLGKLLRVKLIDRYKVSSGVIESLQSGNTLYINQALKCDWFFASVEDPATFVQNTIPTFSFSTRMKVLNKFALCLKNTNAGEVLYLNLKSRYGVRTAVVLMPACSEIFIKNELPNLAILLPRGVVLALYEKYPSITTEYINNLLGGKFSKISSCYKRNMYEYIFVKLATNDLDSFLDLIEKHAGYSIPKIKLGKRPTKKLIKLNFDRVSLHYDKYSPVLNNKHLMPHLSAEKMKQLYVSGILPENVSDFLKLHHWSEVFEFLNYLKPSFRSDVFKSTFQRKYNKNCTSDSILFELRSFMLKYLPTEAKIKWVDKKLEETKDIKRQAEIMTHLPVEISIPRLKKLITLQSDGTIRSTIAEMMVMTLKINNCSSGLKDLVAYFVKRFRNEVTPFRSGVISKMSELDHLYLELEMDDWGPIYDLINIIKLNKELGHCWYGIKTILECQILACFTKNVEVEPYLRKYADFIVQIKGHFLVQLCKGTPYQRNCLEWMLCELPNMQCTANRKTAFSVELLEELCTFNSKHKGNKIELPQWLIKDVEGIFAETDLTEYRIRDIVEFLTNSKEFELREHFLTICFPNYITCQVLCRSLKKNPDLILSHLGPILKKLFNEKKFRAYSLFFKKCRLYDSFGITDKITETCHKVLEQEMQKCSEPSTTGENAHDNSDDESTNLLVMKPSAIQILSLLQEPTHYLDLCSEHVPELARVDNYSNAIAIEYNIQAAVCKSFARIANPSEALPILRKFTVGDFLKLVCGSLTTVCIKIPEQAILPLLKEWMDCPVSLRKHILRLVYQIAPIQYSADSFLNLFQTEKNTSLRLILFKKLQERFIAEPSEDSYKMFKSIIEQLTTEDGEIMGKLFDVCSINEKFISRYLELLWHLIDTTWTKLLPNGKTMIVDRVDQITLQLLDDKFLDKLLSYEMSSKLPNSCLSGIVCHYLLCCPSNEIQRYRLDKVITILAPFIEQHWEDRDFSSGSVFKMRMVVSDLVLLLCRLSGDYKDVNAVQMLTDFNRRLSSLIKPIDFLNESILLEWHVMYRRDNLTEITKLIPATARLYDKYILEYESQIGSSIINRLSNVTSSLSSFVSRKKIAYELLTTSDHPYAHVLAIEVVKTGPFNVEDVPQYVDIMNVLTNSKHPHVQSSASEFFRSLSFSKAYSHFSDSDDDLGFGLFD